MELDKDFIEAVQRDLTEDTVDAELSRRSFFYFLQLFWEEIIPEIPVYNWHIEYLCNELQNAVEKVFSRDAKERDIVINIPPGTTKSTIITVMLPAWVWIRDGSIRTLTASYAATLSTDHAVKSRDIIKSDRFRRLFPQVQLKADQDNKTHYKNTQGGERYATSVGGAITGFHAHLLIVDDPLNPKGAASQVERDTANNFMDTTLSTRKVDKLVSLTILVMQRLHEYDCTGNWLKKKKEIKHICLPAEVSKDINPPELSEYYHNGLLDPVRISRNALEQAKVDLGSYGFSGQMMQTPTPEGGGLWKQWFVPISRLELARLKLQDLATDWDLAYTKKETNSASAYITSGKNGRNMYIVDAGYDYLEFPELIKYMLDLTAPHYIEGKASGKSAKQTLKSHGVPAIEVKVEDGDKIARTTISTPYAEAGMIYIAEDLVNFVYNDSKQGILLFPNTGTDLNDALTQAISRLLKKSSNRVRSSNSF
tara:strand:+ start:2518 stop:3960 length:1443 start_codon:yes stop_codon:yes gene_type:complete